MTAAPRQSASGPTGPSAGIGARCLLMVLLFVPLNVAFLVSGNWLLGSGAFGGSMTTPAVCGLFVLAMVNLALKRLAPRWAFAPGELITVYVALALSTCLCATTTDWGAALAPSITWPVWNASAGNDWQAMMWPNLPPWLIVTNHHALEGFYIGRTNPYQREVLLAWAQPALWWTAWLTAMLWVSLCLNVIVHRRWSQEERLPFPMTVLPLSMTDPQTRLFRSGLFWVGAAGAASVLIMNSLSGFLPAVPAIPLVVNLDPYIANRFPWDGLRGAWLSWEPWYVGLSYLMPVDLAFSLVVFNIAWRAEYVLARLMGWMVSPYEGFPYGDQQTIGSYLGVIGFVLWLDRRYLLQVFRKAVGLHSRADDSDEVFSYRTATLGAIGGLGFLWWFFARAGMSNTVIPVFLGLYFLMGLVMGRMRAHLGPPYHGMSGVMPEFALTEFPGTRALGARTLGMLALVRPYMLDQGLNPTPVQLEALRMAERPGLQRNRLAWVMVGVTALGMLAYFWANIQVGYSVGLGTGAAHQWMTITARDPAERLDEWLRGPTLGNWSGLAAIAVGLGATGLLMLVKVRFPAWPLHPVALPLATGWVIDTIMPAVIGTLVVKAVLLRYGGLRAHRRALPFFLGITTGSAVTLVCTSIVFRALALSR